MDQQLLAGALPCLGFSSCLWHASLHAWTSDLHCHVSVSVLENVRKVWAVWHDCLSVVCVSDVSEHKLASVCSGLQMSDVGVAVASCTSTKGERTRVYVGDL
eukprot:6463644-Amphidinium_carterae.1